MDKEDFKRIVSNPQFIEGVYNYCDRWCERCRFRSRCANYAVSEEQLMQDNPDTDPDEAFWDNVNEMFEITMDMIEEIAEEKGLNLDLADPDTYKEQQKTLDDKCRTHECTSAGSDYIKMVEEWFEKAENLLQNKEDELNMQAEINEISDKDPSREAYEIDDAIEVIQWYQTQIYVKLMRAVKGTAERDTDLLEEGQTDSEGSAKVALIGIDRSIASWGVLYNYFPQRENEIIDIFVHLDRLRKTVEHAFPHAREFVRPGFDEEQYKEVG